MSGRKAKAQRRQKPYRTLSLFAGYGGIALGLAQHLPIKVVAYAEYDPDPARIMAFREPGVTNLWDVTTVDWEQVDAEYGPIDIVEGGSPCQDLSHAGKRGGMRSGTRSGLWASMRDAIAVLRPRLVVWENVRGALSAAADSEVEFCPGCVGDGSGEPALRALGRVLGDLSDLGYDAQWYGLRVADVGGAHGRFRIFVFAWPRDDPRPRVGAEWVPAGLTQLEDGDARLLPTATSSDRNGPGRRKKPNSDDLRTVAALDLLPTPAASVFDGSPEAFDDRLDRMADREGGGPSGVPLAVEVQRLLPTPRAHDSDERPETFDERNALVYEESGIVTGVPLGVEVQRLMPTPVAADGKRSTPSKKAQDEHGGTTLAEEVRLLPTAIASDAGQGGGSTPSDVTLTDAVVRTDLGRRPNPRHEPPPDREVPLLPTPNTFDALDPRSPEALARARSRGGTSNLKDLDLVREQTLLPTPSAAAGAGGQKSRSGDRKDELLLGGVAQAAADGTLLPTPRATDGEKGGPNQRGSSGDPMLPSAVAQLPLIPTPTANDWKGSTAERRQPGQHRHQLDAFTEGETDWGPYTAGVRRAERLFAKRPAPPPTMMGSQGRPVLSPVFVEWHMGLPAGWVTDDRIWDGMSLPAKRNAELKALGNGVSPPQCGAAFGAYLLDRYLEEHPDALVAASPGAAGAGPLLQTPIAREAEKASNSMGVARRAATGQVFLTNQIASLTGLDPTEGEAP